VRILNTSNENSGPNVENNDQNNTDQSATDWSESSDSVGDDDSSFGVGSHSDDDDEDAKTEASHYEPFRMEKLIPLDSTYKRSKKQYDIRNSVIRKLLQLYAQTDTHSALFTV